MDGGTPKPTVNGFTMKSQLQVTVMSAKLKDGRKNWFGPNPYVEVSVDGQSKKTETRNNTHSPKWKQHLTVIVTPFSALSFRVWSHQTLKSDALLGSASLNLQETLLANNMKLEEVMVNLQLQGDRETVGDLSVCLNGLQVDPELLANGEATCVPASDYSRVQMDSAAAGADSTDGSSPSENRKPNGTNSPSLSNGGFKPSRPPRPSRPPPPTPQRASIPAPPFNSTETPAILAGSATPAPETDVTPGVPPVSRQVLPVNIDGQRMGNVNQGALPPGYDGRGVIY